MPINTTTVTLSHERAEQLRQIALSFGGLTMPETIGRMARELAHLGVVQTNIAGIEIDRCADGLVICLNDGAPVGLTVGQAHELADQLEFYIESPEKLGPLMNLDSDYVLSRQALTVNIRLPADGPVRRLPRDIARDLAAMLRREADLIEHNLAQPVD